MRGLLIGSAVTLGMVAGILALLGAIPPSTRIHWYLVAFGIGLPAAALLLAITVALVLGKLGFTAPSDGGHRSFVHAPPRSSEPRGHGNDEE